jgi:hypothetical protein|tara:strand:- start:222 stop:368 length:147 start_codon:yes stop_codon:yes gene_type:complete
VGSGYKCIQMMLSENKKQVEIIYMAEHALQAVALQPALRGPLVQRRMK